MRLTNAARDACAFRREQFPRVESLLGDRVLVRGGLAIFYGDVGLGKSWLALMLGRAMARSEKWMGLPTRPQGLCVGLVQLELHGSLLQERLAALGIGDDERDHNLRIIARPLLQGPIDLAHGDLAALRTWIEDNALEVVFLDAFSRTHTVDERGAELNPILAGLDVIRGDTGCAIVLVHHERKSPAGPRNGDDDLDALRGSSRLQSDPTLLVRIAAATRDSGGPRVIRFAKVSTGPTPPPIYFTLDEHGEPCPCEAPGEMSRAKGQGNRDRVREVVLAAGRLVTADEVQATVKLSRSTVRDHLAALVQTNTIRSEGANRNTVYGPPDRPTVRAGEVGRSNSSLFNGKEELAS